MIFVKTSLSFYLIRFCLRIVEAGFFPRIIFYLTYWFPVVQRAKTVALFITATAIAGVVRVPGSGLLLTLQGIMELAGWQRLFFLEGSPAIFLGFVVLRYLCDRPEQAEWLEPEELLWLQERL
jgi:ACS family tartrate transporter-like MFS transporter